MAKLIGTKFQDGDNDLFNTDIKEVTLSLTGQEAIVLSKVLGNIAGSPLLSARRYCGSIGKALSKVEKLEFEKARLHSALQTVKGDRIEFLPIPKST